MKTLWMILFLLVAGSIIAYVWAGDNNDEGFQDLEERKSVVDFLTNFFQYRQASFAPAPAGLNIAKGSLYAKQIPVDPGFRKLDAIDAATATFGDSATTKASKYFYVNSTRLLELDEACRQASNPRSLMERAADADYGCGWWYVADPMIPSTAAYGSYKDPHAESRLTADHPGGVWLWDLREAEQKEDIKRCKRIRSCEFINAEDIRGKCAFCPELGYAVPVTDTGALKYPTIAEAVCGDTNSMILDAGACPAPRFVPRLAANDYEYDANGNVIEGPNTDARRLYEAGALDLNAECQPYEGKLSVTCLVNLARSAGFGTEGAMIRLLKTGGPLTEADRVAFDILEKKGSIVVTEALWKRRAIGRDEASTLFGKMATFGVAAPNAAARDAARWFIYGRAFDVCEYAGTDKGPFPVECLQREFRKAGCQAAGAAYPTAASAPSFADSTMSDIRGQFRNLFETMNRDPALSIKEQDDAVKACLGVTQVRAESETWIKSPNVCNDKGVEYVVFDDRMIVGRFVSTSAFLSESSPVAQVLVPLLRRVQQGPPAYLARTVLRGGSTATKTWTLRISNIPAGASYRVLAAGKEVAGGPVWSVTVQPRTQVLVEVFFRGAPLTKDPYVPAWGVVEAEGGLLIQSRWRPFVALDVAGGAFTDAAKLLTVTAPSVVDVTATGNMVRRGLRLSRKEITVPMGLRSDVPTTVTCMFSWSSLQSSANLLQLAGRPGTAEQGPEVIAISIQNRVPTFVFSTAKAAYSIPFTVTLRDYEADAWWHVTAVISADPGRTRLYWNGTEATGKPVVLPGFVADTTPFAIQSMVLGGTGFAGGIAWVHMYAQPLSANQIARDVAYDDPQYRDDTEEVTTGEQGILSDIHGFQMLRNKTIGAEASPMRTEQASSLDACASRAAELADCVVFDYNTSTKACRFFKEVKETNYGPGTDAQVVGRKPYKSRVGYEWRGRPLGVVKNIGTPQQCAKICGDAREARSGTNPVCGGFTFTAADGTCRLFRSLETQNQVSAGQDMYNTVSGRMPYNTDDYNVALRRGAVGVPDKQRCTTGMYEYGVKDGRPGKCCPVAPQDAVGSDYQTCFIPPSLTGKKACSLNPLDKFMDPCKGT